MRKEIEYFFTNLESDEVLDYLSKNGFKINGKFAVGGVLVLFDGNDEQGYFNHNSLVPPYQKENIFLVKGFSRLEKVIDGFIEKNK